MGFVQRNPKHENRDLKELAYTSRVTSILEYSSTGEDPFYQKDIDMLEMVLRRAAGLVFIERDVANPAQPYNKSKRAIRSNHNRQW